MKTISLIVSHYDNGVAHTRVFEATFLPGEAGECSEPSDLRELAAKLIGSFGSSNPYRP